MNFRPGERNDVEVNITPLIDVVFLLLIFFMVSTTFQREAELKVQLPEATTREAIVEQTPIEIVINPVGDYFVGGQELVNNNMVTLRAALIEVTEGRIDQPLVIRADARSPHQSVVTAMDVASQLGLYKLSIATSQSGDQP
ncbi:MAG: biopolymer transporter ExbD [Pseudomonadota bacterium]